MDFPVVKGVHGDFALAGGEVVGGFEEDFGGGGEELVGGERGGGGEVDGFFGEDFDGEMDVTADVVEHVFVTDQAGAAGGDFELARSFDFDAEEEGGVDLRRGGGEREGEGFFSSRLVRRVRRI